MTSPHVLGTAEARTSLPAILESFREQGGAAEPVFIGAYRQPEAVLISVGLAERIAPLIEELLLADQIRERLGSSNTSTAGDEVVRNLGIDEDDIAVETAALLRQLSAPAE